MGAVMGCVVVWRIKYGPLGASTGMVRHYTRMCLAIAIYFDADTPNQLRYVYCIYIYTHTSNHRSWYPDCAMRPPWSTAVMMVLYIAVQP